MSQITKRHQALYPESRMRAAALEWLVERHALEHFVVDLCLFHEKHVTVDYYLKQNLDETQRRRIPYWGRSRIRPDHFGLVDLPSVGMLGCIVAECKARTLEPKDIMQAYHYANACDAYAAYLFWDSKAGFTDEAFHSIAAIGGYRGIDPERGGTRSNHMTYVMYDEPSGYFCPFLEDSFVLRSVWPTWKPLAETAMPKRVT